jgi:hypothetical protein
MNELEKCTESIGKMREGIQWCIETVEELFPEIAKEGHIQRDRNNSNMVCLECGWPVVNVESARAQGCTQRHGYSRQPWR